MAPHLPHWQLPTKQEGKQACERSPKMLHGRQKATRSPLEWKPGPADGEGENLVRRVSRFVGEAVSRLWEDRPQDPDTYSHIWILIPNDQVHPRVTGLSLLQEPSQGNGDKLLRCSDEGKCLLKKTYLFTSHFEIRCEGAPPPPILCLLLADTQPR